MADGLLDTNVLIHAQTRDEHAEECLGFLEALQVGRRRARIEPLVLHELSYALPHYRKGMTRSEVAECLLAILGWDGVTGDKSVMVSTVQRWRDTAGLAFVDAYLATLAIRDGCAVYTKNAGELTRQGVEAPSPLPGH
ncbi:MAG: PIN domain-containing protein [Chloroflexota bacterium]